MTTLEDKFDSNVSLNKKTTVRVSNEIPTEQGVEVHYKVMFGGAIVEDTVDKDYNVTFASALRKSFLNDKVTDEQGQDNLRTWAEQNATKENPYQVHVSNLGTQIKTKEQRMTEARNALKSLGLTTKEEIEEFLNSQ